MAQWHELKSAQYFQTPADSSVTTENEPNEHEPKKSAVEIWQQVSKWISAVAALAVVVCMAVLAVPHITSALSHKGSYPIDWWLHFGGASSDQTFEKFVRNAAAGSQIDWDEQYRKSPMYQFNQSGGLQLNPDVLNWHPQPVGKLK